MGLRLERGRKKSQKASPRRWHLSWDWKSKMKGWRDGGGALQAGRGQMMWSPVGPIKELRFTLRVNLVCYLEQRKKCRNHDEYVSIHSLPKSGSFLLPPFIFFLFLWWKNFNSYKSKIVEWISIFPLSSFIHDQLMASLVSFILPTTPPI